MRFLDPPLVSRIGARMARGTRPRRQIPDYVERLGRVAQKLRPDLIYDDKTREAFVDRWWENNGRTYAEFASLHRIMMPDHLSIDGLAEAQKALNSGRSIVTLLVHLGNWELIGRASALAGLGSGWVSVYEPQPNRFQNRILYEVRRRCGVFVFPPSITTARRLLKTLGDGHNLAMLIDEVSDGQIKFPLFGRAVPKACNLINALKLAARNRSLLLPCYLLRTGDGCHKLTVLPPIPSDVDGLEGEAYLEIMSRRLNSIFEPIVIAHLEQWYMLHTLDL